MLSTLSSTLSETFNLLLKAFRLSSLFPAFCFALVQGTLLLFYPFNQNLVLSLKDTEFAVPASLIFFVFLLTALLGYVLNYLNGFLMFVAEGYPFIDTPWGRVMRTWYGAHKRWLETQVAREDVPELVRLLYLDKLNDDFPPEVELCAPTSLGNVTAAFEAYPDQRYGIDAVYLWPRLVPVLSKEKFAIFVEREKEGLDFFLNLSALSIILGLESVVLRIVLGDIIFSWIAFVSGCAAYLFYRATVKCARDWGETIKTAFDLYRYQLADELALAQFEDRREEVKRWKKLSYFIKYGQWLDFGEYAYPLPDAVRKQSADDQG